MILGRIIGKVTTSRFEFLAQSKAKKFMYCQVYHKEYDYVLCQIMELEKTKERIIAKCNVIGYKDQDGNIKSIRSPFDVGTDVLQADEDLIRKVVMPKSIKSGAYIGLLEGTSIPIKLDLNKVLTKHLAVLAKSGSGKSYSVGVLLEEIMERNVPLIVVDPHGEYSTLTQQNDNVSDIEKMGRFSEKPKAYKKKVEMYGDTKLDPEAKPLRLNQNFSATELVDMLPAKISNNQLGILYTAIKNLDDLNFENLLFELASSENSQKWNLINMIEYLHGLDIFSSNPTSLNEIVQSGKCSVINLKGIDPSVQDIIICKLLKDLFSARKRGEIPPFFLVCEEAHNFIPEKGFSDAKSSKIIKTIASEGRKFGLGLCIVSQRPAIVQKTVLSQATTQIIMKMTNPNDLKAISASVEGITSESQDEIKNLPVGTGLITGVMEMPIFVNIRPRRTKHGGEAVNILGELEDEEKFMEKVKDFDDRKLMPLIVPNIQEKDLKIMADDGSKIVQNLVPCTMFLCRTKNKEFNLLIDMTDGAVVLDIETMPIRKALLPELDKLTPHELKVLQKAFKLKEFDDVTLIKSSGLGLDAKEHLENLIRLGYIHDKGQQRYSISDRYILSNLNTAGIYRKIEYKKTDYEKKLSKGVNLDQMRRKLGKFTTISDQRECFLVTYSLE